MTGLELIQHAVQKGAGLPRDPIQTDVYDYAFAELNNWGQKIWDLHPWLNRKTTVVSVVPDSTGLITFASTVDIVRGIREATTNTSTSPTPIFAQDEIYALSQHAEIDTNRFQHREDDASGNRQIKVSDETDPTARTFEAVVFKRFVPWTSVTISTDAYIIDVAEQALQEFLVDELRNYSGAQKLEDGHKVLQIAINKEMNHYQREHRAAPQQPRYTESGGNYY